MDCIFDNIIFSLQTSGGISNYWFEIIRRMQECQEVNFKFIEDLDESKKNLFRKKLMIEQENILTKRLNLFTRILPLNVTNYKKDFIFHSSYYRTTYNKNAKVITTIHDFIAEKVYNKKFSKSVLMRKLAIINSDHFIAISNNTKFDFLNLYPQISEDKVTVIYNGVSNDYFQINNKENFESKYVLFVGSRAYYKNFDFVVNVVSKFDKLKLYIVGGELTENEKRLLINKLNPSRFKLFANISNSELNILYNYASALIYPSSYEGFGIPIIEAMKAGCQVIALNRSSIPEIAGGAAILIDKLDTHDFYDAINFTLFQDKFSKSGIENSKKYSWDKTFSETFNLYNKLLK